jgi:hypothetical protein
MKGGTLYKAGRPPNPFRNPGRLPVCLCICDGKVMLFGICDFCYEYEYLLELEIFSCI